MIPALPAPLALIDAARPVFLIVMAISLVLFVWRLAKYGEGWSAWFLMAGALLLGFGYGLILPLIEAESLRSSAHHHHHAVISSSMATLQVIKAVSMNLGWLMLGIGFAFHSHVFAAAPPPRLAATRARDHESFA